MSDYRDRNDPLYGNTSYEPVDSRGGTVWSWIAGAAVFLVIVVAVAFGVAHEPSRVASNGMQSTNSYRPASNDDSRAVCCTGPCAPTRTCDEPSAVARGADFKAARIIPGRFIIVARIVPRSKRNGLIRSRVVARAETVHWRRRNDGPGSRTPHFDNRAACSGSRACGG